MILDEDVSAITMQRTLYFRKHKSLSIMFWIESRMIPIWILPNPSHVTSYVEVTLMKGNKNIGPPKYFVFNLMSYGWRNKSTHWTVEGLSDHQVPSIPLRSPIWNIKPAAKMRIATPFNILSVLLIPTTFALYYPPILAPKAGDVIPAGSNFSVVWYSPHPLCPTPPQLSSPLSITSSPEHLLT